MLISSYSCVLFPYWQHPVSLCAKLPHSQPESCQVFWSTLLCSDNPLQLLLVHQTHTQTQTQAHRWVAGTVCVMYFLWYMLRVRVCRVIQHHTDPRRRCRQRHCSSSSYDLSYMVTLACPIIFRVHQPPSTVRVMENKGISLGQDYNCIINSSC